MKAAFVLCICLFLASCASPAERRAQAIQEASWACADMGYQPETDGHRACVQQLYMQKQANQSAADAARRAAATAAGIAILTAPPPRPTQTNCRWFANQWVCN